MKIVAFLLLFTFSSASYADYQAISDKFFTFIKAGDTDAALDYLYGENPWVSTKSDSVVSIKTEILKLNNLVGQYIFHEAISTTEVGTRYVHIIYLVGYERQPVRFELSFYKAESEWNFQGLSFDTRLTDEIKKQANAQLRSAN